MSKCNLATIQSMSQLVALDEVTRTDVKSSLMFVLLMGICQRPAFKIKNREPLGPVKRIQRIQYREGGVRLFHSYVIEASIVYTESTGPVLFFFFLSTLIIADA